MDRPRLALLNASFNGEDTSRNFRRELDADIAEYDAHEQIPATFDFDGIVVTGSAASVYWDEPWIDDLLDWVTEAVNRGLPHLGVCYGHQVLAEALGGEVRDMDGYEIGYREVNRVGESILLEGLEDPFTVFTTHGDEVVELPPGAEPIAENDYANHGFQRDHVFTVQFHPEYDMETAKRVTEGKDFLGEERIQRTLEGITDENYARACEAKQLFDNFVGYVHEIQDVGRPLAR